MSSSPESFTNYVAYQTAPPFSKSRIGHLNFENATIQPLSYASGTWLSNLYEVIEIGEDQIIPSGDTIPLDSVKILPPISGRDVLAVGKNYFKHAIEFNSSGYDSSDKTDQPTHPVIFTKRATSIIGHGDTIYSHPEFTQTLDYEGEIGVIIGKSGFRISEENAMDHVWGYTIINDVTARERQRDHKQFYIGKSGDTFCPMGPIAVPAKHLPKTLAIQTHVNGQKRQDSTTDDLIFSVPVLIRTLSEGTTLQLGDVIATGTPAGVGFGQKPPVFLQPGDVVEISVTGLGTLKNTIGDGSENTTEARIDKSYVPINDLQKNNGRVDLPCLNSKQLYYFSEHPEEPNPKSLPIIFIHGLGSEVNGSTPLLRSPQFKRLRKTHSMLFIDLEGHGSSPTSATSFISIASYASDVYALVQNEGITNVTIVAQDMGCLIACLLAVEHPELVSRLVLIGPIETPLSPTLRDSLYEDCCKVRMEGMDSIVGRSGVSRLSKMTREENPIVTTTVALSLLHQDAEGYAKACMAILNETESLPLDQIKANTLIVTGSEDTISTPAICKEIAAKIPTSTLEILPETGHWSLFENWKGLATVIAPFVSVINIALFLSGE